MTIKIFEKYGPDRANAPTTAFPQGSIKNESVPGANDGTPLDQDWGNDYAGFDAALFADAEITPDGNVDTAIASQRFDALKISANKAAQTPVTLTSVVTDTTLKINMVRVISDRMNSIFDVVLASSVTPNGLDIIQCTGVPALALKMRELNEINILQLGAIPDWDGSTGTDVTDIIVHAVTNYPNTIIPKGYDFAVGENGSCFWDGVSNRKIYGGGTLHKTGSKGIFSFRNCTDITVHNINFDGQIVADETANGNIIDETRSATDYAFAISFAECNSCIARNNYVYDFAWDGIVAQGVVDPGGTTATQATGITFYKNTLTKIRGSQLWLKAVSGFDVSKNKGSNPTDFNQKANMIFMVEWCNEGVVSHNRGFYIGDNFISVGEMLSTVIEARNKNIQIHDNVVDITRYHSILIAQGENIHVHDNTITNAAYKDNMTGGADAVLSAGITALGGSDGVTTAPRNTRINIHDNIINNSREYGIYVFDRSSTTFNDSSDDIKIHSNIITNAGRGVLTTRIASGGILTQIQKTVSIKNNECTFCLGDGVRVFGDAIIQGNTCELNSGRGILVPDDTIWGNTKLSGDISNNTCNKNGGTGIEMASHSDGVFVSNECSENGFGSAPVAENGVNSILHAGIGLQSVTRVSLSNNTCDKNGSSGISTYLCYVVDQSMNHTSDNGGNFTVDNFRSGTYMEGDGVTGVDSTVFMGKGDPGTEQQYAVRILFSDNAVALDCKYVIHPLGIVGAVEKSSFNI